jgi:Uma2 family endonuclease
MATQASPPYRITVEQFLSIEWESDTKAELDNGVIRMMAGGSLSHSRIQGNVFAALHVALRGTGCRPHASDMGVRTNDISLRYPDVSVFCGKDDAQNDDVQVFDDPAIVVEVLSPTTRGSDLQAKLAEYRELPSLCHIVYIDPEEPGIRLLTRTGTKSWNDAELAPGDSVDLSRFNISLSWDEIFARA